MGKKKKDRWHIAYKNFLHLSYGGVFIGIAFLAVWIFDIEPLSETAGTVVISALVSAAIWYYLSQLFKKRDKKAVPLGYIILLISLAGSIFQGINIFVLIALGYFLYIVWRVGNSKTHPPAQQQKTSNVDVV